MHHKVYYFWLKRGLLNYLLLPFSWIFRLILSVITLSANPKKVPAVVICVGNVTVGGSGKTPIAIAIAKMLIQEGHKIAFISRGYKGSLSQSDQAVKVNSFEHSAFEVGDEPLLLSKTAPTYICVNRHWAAIAAIADGASIIVMDDGFQNYTLVKDLNILVVDAEYGIGNGMLLPAGPLREPLSDAIRKADYVCINRGNSKDCNLSFSKPTFMLETKVVNANEFENQRYIALCAIANPLKFLNTLAMHKVIVPEKFFFPDHHLYTDAELNEVIETAKRHGCKIITTSKDLVKIGFKHQKWFKTIEIDVKLPEILQHKMRDYILRFG